MATVPSAPAESARIIGTRERCQKNLLQIRNAQSKASISKMVWEAASPIAAPKSKAIRRLTCSGSGMSENEGQRLGAFATRDGGTFVELIRSHLLCVERGADHTSRSMSVAQRIG